MRCAAVLSFLWMLGVEGSGGACTYDADMAQRAAAASATIEDPPPVPCRWWCRLARCGWKKTCGGCPYCPNPSPATTCPLATFVDVTAHKFPPEDGYWHSWMHSGKPYSNEGAPLLVDVNGDGVLDFFHSMHGHPVHETLEYCERMELGEAVPPAFSLDNVAAATGTGQWRFRNVAPRVIINDVTVIHMDTHGQNILDLDGDGILDLMISSGGGRGGSMGENMARSRDNFLFWGERGVDELTGKQVTVFRGGRDVARAAGVDMRFGRGRINYMLDVNLDGLIDIFCLQDRRESNEVAPGVLLLNQGNRTWREVPEMSEYTRSMILTDADGDGHAEEILLSRGYCYPQRDGPGVDPEHPELGPFPADKIAFCRTRPVGSMAVYRFNHTTLRMENEAPAQDLGPEAEAQPACCRHGSWAGNANCHVISMSSADLDGDLRADHVFLYTRHLDIYFSSDRAPGVLPLSPGHVGASLVLPERCRPGMSVRVVDLDNDGVEEIVVLCRSVSTLVVYTRGSSKDSWTLNNGCNLDASLGDFSDRSLAEVTAEDCASGYPFDKLTDACNRFMAGRPTKVHATGMSMVDLDNDGFLDIVVAHAFGYVRFFRNNPSAITRKNRYIAFALMGKTSAGSGNAYGIGATVVLETRHNRKTVRQFREVSSYQHTTDKYGHKEDRIIFGLGPKHMPRKLVVSWPNRQQQVRWLSWWQFKQTARRPFVIRQQ